MITLIEVRLTREQQTALLGTKLFDGKSPMSLRLPDGVVANTADWPARIEVGRSFRKKPRREWFQLPAGRLEFVRSDMNGWADLLLESYKCERRCHRPHRFEARFGRGGRIAAAHEVLLTLRDIGVTHVAATFVTADETIRAVYAELGYDPEDPGSWPKDEAIAIDDLLALTTKWYNLQKTLTLPRSYTIEGFLTGQTNIIP
ncbi:MAG: hypothetical protein AAB360_03920 [Patescibacteria group bacterium]